MPKERVRVAKVERLEDAQLTEIVYQLEAIRDSMATIVEAQMDLQKLVAEGNKYHDAAARLHEINKRDTFRVFNRSTVKPEDMDGVRWVNLETDDDWASVFAPKEEKKTEEYAFCFDTLRLSKTEDVCAATPWHLRLSSARRRGSLSSLCFRTMVYSINVPVCEESLLTEKICPVCAIEYLKLEGEKSDGNEKKDRAHYGTEEKR